MSPIVDCVASGPKGSPALVLIPPLGADLTFWDECVAIWRRDVFCLAVTPRCVAQGPSGAEPVGLVRHVSDLDEVRRQFGVERVVVVGCAVGSMIAAAYAAAHPNETVGLVMANATPRSSEQACHMLEQRAELVDREGMAAILPQAVDRPFLNQPRDERYRRYLDAFATQSAHDYAMACRAAARFDVLQDLPRIACPTLVVPGEHDALLPPALSREVQALIPGARLETMADAAHFVPFQQPARFAAAVLDLVMRCGPDQPSRLTEVTMPHGPSA